MQKIKKFPQMCNAYVMPKNATLCKCTNPVTLIYTKRLFLKITNQLAIFF